MTIISRNGKIPPIGQTFDALTKARYAYGDVVAVKDEEGNQIGRVVCEGALEARRVQAVGRGERDVARGYYKFKVIQ